MRLVPILILALSAVACDDEVKTSADGGSSGEDAGTSPVPGPYDSCEVASDCAWGEIDHEILKPSDCVCLLGCPHIPLSKSTVERRASQHQQLCDPHRDGQGDPCPIDDCAQMPPLACSAGTCEPAEAGSAH